MRAFVGIFMAREIRLYLSRWNETANLKSLVGERGFEPPAPTSRTWCSTRLSYSPALSGGGLITRRLPGAATGSPLPRVERPEATSYGPRPGAASPGFWGVAKR